LPDRITSACSSWSTVYSPPGPMPTFVPSWLASSCVPVTFVSGRSSRMTTMESRTLISDAGRSRACGSFAARTAPESRSEMIQVAAVTAGGAAAPSGVTMPHSPIRAPPTGSSGTGSGSGLGLPGAGSSDVSIGGGGSWRCWQAPPLPSGDGWPWRALRAATAPGAATIAVMTRAHNDRMSAGTDLVAARRTV
jgi:hypothetical protein